MLSQLFFWGNLLVMMFLTLSRVHAHNYGTIHIGIRQIHVDTTYTLMFPYINASHTGIQLVGRVGLLFGSPGFEIKFQPATYGCPSLLRGRAIHFLEWAVETRDPYPDSVGSVDPDSGSDLDPGGQKLPIKLEKNEVLFCCFKSWRLLF